MIIEWRLSFLSYYWSQETIFNSSIQNLEKIFRFVIFVFFEEYFVILSFYILLFFQKKKKRKSLNIDQFQRLIIFSFSSFEEIWNMRNFEDSLDFIFRYFSSNIELTRRIFFLF